ncbi:TPA: hypothetical protein I6799_001772 [Vibrio cholerae]|uniref:Replication protein n=1 Tax=Vibrio rhizosphaerae TaxID=398736 RepID=A0ABU4IQI4_9VIBR|nr:MULTISPECIES: hypothetical protein [Gammaproteobacteria]GHZ39588.1 Primosomal protein I [Vibrio cholerae]KHT30423.1 hypothetical protein RC99_16905 [Pectobacterium carotovorum subsp. carotovorum]MDW6091514.1 hypothetical protein [Vibrio rhizosphaerae]HAS4284022.1 hypothetical protein [Vibrio cholerae]HAS4302201.1 hypothetical protein [Vibrio cholerae]
MNSFLNSADLARAIDGPRIAIPRASIQALGLEAAAFLQQASFLSSLKAEAGGWFDLPAEGEPDPEATNIFAELGSWQACLGIQRDALRKIRRKLCEMSLLEEKRAGVPARLHYRVNHDAYLRFLADCGQKIQNAENRKLDAEYPQTSLQGSRIQECGVSADYSRKIQESFKDINNTRSKARFDFVEALVSRGVDPIHAREWQAIRKKKRVTLTEEAVLLTEREAEKAGINLGDAIETCALRGWAGFKADWLTPNNERSSQTRSLVEDLTDTSWAQGGW